jgi:hypothetical protein
MKDQKIEKLTTELLVAQGQIKSLNAKNESLQNLLNLSKQGTSAAPRRQYR